MKTIFQIFIFLVTFYLFHVRAEEPATLKFAINSLFPDAHGIPRVVIGEPFCEREGNKLKLPEAYSTATVFNANGATIYPALTGCFRGGDTALDTAIYNSGEASRGAIWTDLETNIDGVKDLRFSLLGKHKIKGLSTFELDEKSKYQTVVSELTGLPVRPDDAYSVNEEKLWVKANYWISNRRNSAIVYSVYCHGTLGDYGYYNSECAIPNTRVGSYLYDNRTQTSIKIREGMPLELDAAWLVDGRLLLYGSVRECKSCGFHEAYLIEGDQKQRIFQGEYEGT